MVVFTVSIGIRNILNKPADTLAATVFAATGKEADISIEFKAAIVPVFAAVSPNLDSGP
jgi:hypothetical protein